MAPCFDRDRAESPRFEALADPGLLLLPVRERNAAFFFQASGQAAEPPLRVQADARRSESGICRPNVEPEAITHEPASGSESFIGGKPFIENVIDGALKNSNCESLRVDAHGSILQYRVEPDALRRRSAIWELVGPNVRRLLHASAPASGASSAGTGSPHIFHFVRMDSKRAGKKCLKKKQ